jgi:acetylornithine deacetylase/succinyl-diaminopimelate desuccinylase-like protein
MAYFSVSVQCGGQDLHSGVFGGAVHEAMTDLVALLATLVDSKKGQILVPGISDDVRPLTEEEDALYDTLDFNVNEFIQENSINSGKALHDSKKSLLQHRWRYPSLSIHGIEGAFSGPGAKTVIPAKCIGKFSLRLVPDQDPARIEKLIKVHLESKFAEVRQQFSDIVVVAAKGYYDNYLRLSLFLVSRFCLFYFAKVGVTESITGRIDSWCKIVVVVTGTSQLPSCRSGPNLGVWCHPGLYP